MAVSRSKRGVNDDTKRDSEEAKCDRRLSRAARELLKRHLIRHFQAGSPDDSLWTLLQRILPPDVPDSCPLLSYNDALKADEDHSARIRPKPSNLAYPTSILKHRRKTSSRRPESWFQCGYCQKIFATQYYLDLHMEDHHSKPRDVMTCCPATAWCPALGSSACNEVALEFEPYYDRGSGGWGDDAVHVQHKLTKQAHATPCTTESIKQAKSKCHELMDLCHLDPTHICGSLACPNRLLELHPHEWMEHFRETWSNENSHSVGVFGTLLVIGLLLWYLSFWWSSIVPSGSRRGGRQDPAGRRLLRKSSSAASRSSRFWKMTKRKDSKLE
jgi:hypothetical protein